MASSEWNQIVEVFHAALEKSGNERVVLLDQACGGQSLFRKAVEELLNEHESAGSFLSKPLWDGLPHASCADVPAPGQPFERFALLELLGRGGMGEVWSARDEELDRSVALKFLRAETAFEVDTARVAREARAASALNHPNIVAIHEIVRSKSCSAIVMELVEGSSLAKFRGTPFGLNELLPIGVQIAKGLTAAHLSGIIHGDIKPENIILRKDGYVKILDFGLARRVAIETNGGGDGAIFGTLRYMSPEQGRGESLTPASDVFSFGLVLFELATGTPAYPKASPLDCLHSKLTQDPPEPISVNRRVPAALNGLILAMLAKDPSKRPSAADVARELGRIGSSQTDSNRRFRLAVLTACILAVTAGTWFALHRTDAPEFANLRIEPLTSQAGWEASPAFSPDGKSIAFIWAESVGAPRQIYVKQRGDGTPIELTDPHIAGSIESLVWSPDGKWIAFKRGYERGSGLFLISSSGGLERKILDLKCIHRTSTIDWSPDGKQLVFSDMVANPDRLAIYSLDLRSGKTRRLTTPPSTDAADWDPKFSPDGRTIAFKRVRGFWADNIYTIPADGGKPRQVTWEKGGIWGHTWTRDGKSLILSCQRGSTIFGLWRFPLGRRAPPERIVEGGADAITPATCRKGRELAWVSQIRDMNIYRVAAGGGQPVRLIASTSPDHDPAYSSNGQIAFVSDRSGSREIWLSRFDGSEQKRITNFGGPDVAQLQWSPNGRQLAFYSRAQGRSDIFVLDCNPDSMLCESPKRITSGMKAEVPTWSADGKFLYFASDRTGRWEVWKQALSGQAAIQITYNGGYLGRESRDGAWLYFSKDESEEIWRVSLAANGQSGYHEELVITPDNQVQQRAWALAPDQIIFMKDAEGGQHGAIESYQISSKRIRTILPLADNSRDTREYGLSVSADSKWILYSQLDRSGSNVMIGEDP